MWFILRVNLELWTPLDGFGLVLEHQFGKAEGDPVPTVFSVDNFFKVPKGKSELQPNPNTWQNPIQSKIQQGSFDSTQQRT